MNYFYWLFSERDERIDGYRPEPQYLPCFSNFISEYVQKYGEYLDSEESWKPEYLDVVSTDKKFRMDDYEGGYRTFNEFFTRRIKKGKRPIGEGVVAPVDGQVQNVHRIENGKVDAKIKSTVYHDVYKLLQKEFNSGTLISMFLDIFDYHRIHAPVDMKIMSVNKIPGGNYVGGYVEHINGKYVFDSSDYGWQSIETRVVIEARDLAYERVFVVPVGMSHVGSIEMLCKTGDVIKKGDEIGTFKFGGSCVIMIFEKKELSRIEGKHYLMGETLVKDFKKNLQ